MKPVLNLEPTRWIADAPHHGRSMKRRFTAAQAGAIVAFLAGLLVGWGL